MDVNQNNHDEKKIINPLYSAPNGVTSPIYYIDEALNTEDKFIITRFTDGGRYVRGNLIFYNMNGVEIYAELDHAIYIDLTNKTAMIKPFSIEDEDSKNEDPELRQYTLILVPYGYQEDTDNDSMCRWVAMQGRTTTYEYIRDNIESLDIDPKRSYILTPNVKLKEAFTISQFVDLVKNSNFVEEDDFNIHWYEEEGEEEQ